MATRGEVETHDTIVGLQQRCVHFEICRGARVGLGVDTPFVIVEAEGCHHTLLAQNLDLVDDVIAAVVASTGLTL